MNARLYVGILDGVTIFTFIVQAYVFYLVQFKSPKSMKEYRYFLNTFTIWDMIFTIAASTSLAPNSVQGIFGAEVAGWGRSFRPELQLFCLGFGFYSAALVIMSQDYCLIYRFTVVWLDKRVHEFFMSTPSKIGWFVFQQSIAIFLGTFSYFACVQPNEFAARVALEPPEIQQRLTKFVIWFDVGNSMSAIWFSITLVICFMISETLCGFLIFMIMKHLRRNSDKFSKTTYKLHRQLTLLLAVQVASVPVNFLINDRDVLAALADVEAARKREAELRNKTRIRRLKDTGQEWARLCSCHGVPHLALARSWISLILWFVVVLATMVGFVYLSWFCVHSYLKYDTYISIEISDDQIEFPSVTVCNNSPYQYTRFMQNPQLKGMLQLRNSHQKVLCITLIKLILSALKEKVEAFSRNTYHLHKQLTILLAFQLATPLILVLIPLSAGLVFAFLQMYSTQLIGQVGFIVIEMYGVTNALFTLLFVKPYR
ncbi:Na+ channel domain containing protein [Aphelenchoides bicaudatus]|nr:Na+ channel domain containing protein [Aphelenchoides bicaudatus]